MTPIELLRYAVNYQLSLRKSNSKWNDCEIRNKNLTRIIQDQMQHIGDLKDLLANHPIFPTTIEALLLETPKSAACWKEIDDKVNAHFRVPIELVTVDMALYRENFMTHIWPNILRKGGRFQYEDRAVIKTCTIDEYRAARKMDFINLILYIVDLWDCENRSDAEKSRMARIQGITTIRRVCGETEDKSINHSFLHFYDRYGDNWVSEPAGDHDWNLAGPGVPEIFRYESWYDWR